MLIPYPLGRHAGFEREADTRDRKSIGGYSGDCSVDADHVPFSIQQRAAGITPIQAGLCLKHVLALYAIEIVDLRADDTSGQGPEPALFGMPNGDHAIPDPASVRLVQPHERQGLRNTLKFEQGQIQWL